MNFSGWVRQGTVVFDSTRALPRTRSTSVTVSPWRLERFTGISCLVDARPALSSENTSVPGSMNISVVLQQ